MTQHELPEDDGLRGLEVEDLSYDVTVPETAATPDVIQGPGAAAVDPEFAPKPIRVKRAVMIGGAVLGVAILATRIFGGGGSGEAPDASSVSGGNIPASASANPGASPETDPATDDAGLRHALISRYNSCSVVNFDDMHTSETTADSPTPLNKLSLNMGFDPNLQSDALRKQHIGKGDVTVDKPFVYGVSFASKEDTRGQHLDATTTSTVEDPTHADLLVPVDPADGTVVAVYVEQKATTTDHSESTTRDDLCSGVLEYDGSAHKWQFGAKQLLPEGLEPYTITEMPGN